MLIGFILESTCYSCLFLNYLKREVGREPILQQPFSKPPSKSTRADWHVLVSFYANSGSRNAVVALVT